MGRKISRVPDSLQCKLGSMAAPMIFIAGHPARYVDDSAACSIFFEKSGRLVLEGKRGHIASASFSCRRDVRRQMAANVLSIDPSSTEEESHQWMTGESGISG
ncbi:hypothetical protein [Mesorhizobium sp. L-8-3]|uniref:hypothetical protein n=1 Tax=Mesorhizobium sp. L-8-3 TaxID=2744522 RepID=UPI001927C84D|nr:hypothetical protein [Mesorhizobium sp. L-8-3]